MTGTAIERARPGGVALTEDERRWDHLARMANTFAATALVPKEMQGNPAVVMAALLYCDALGIDPRTNLGAIDVIEGRLEPRAQVYLATAAIHGWETMWGHVERSSEGGRNTIRVTPQEPTDERAELLIRPYGANVDAWQSFSFTIEQARQAGRLDEWVERWTKNDEGRNYKDTFVLGREGVEVPEWAAKEIKAGRIKRNENWSRYPADMLAARAAKRAVRRAAPNVMFGSAPAVRYAAPEEAVAAEVFDHMPIDVEAEDEAFDVEEVAADAPSTAAPPGPGPAPGSRRPVEPAPVPSPDDDSAPASELERRAVLMVVETLTQAQRRKLLQLLKTAGIPSIERSGDFTHADCATVLCLIDELRGVGTAAGPPVPPDGSGGPPDPAPPVEEALPLDDGRPFS